MINRLAEDLLVATNITRSGYLYNLPENILIGAAFDNTWPMVLCAYSATPSYDNVTKHFLCYCNAGWFYL